MDCYDSCPDPKCETCEVTKYVAPGTVSVKPNIIFVGDVSDEDAQSFVDIENVVVIRCGDAEQVRQMLKTGKAEFTIFGEEA